MVETRLAELKRDQDTTQAVVNGLVDRLEAVTVQIKDLQEQANHKWEGIQTQLAAISKATLVRRDKEVNGEQTGSWFGEMLHRSPIESQLVREERGNPFPKLEFPAFDGTNLEDWIYRCERYFDLERTAESMKVRLASVFMYGKALQWHYTYIKNRGRVEMPSWAEYIEALSRRFGKAVFEDPMGRLKNLRHEGSNDNLHSYMEEFDSCLRKVLERVDIPEEFQISLFINGLKEEYRRSLWLLKPIRLLDAQSNARLLSNDVPPDPAQGGAAMGGSSHRVYSRGPALFTNTRVQPRGEMVAAKGPGTSSHVPRPIEPRSQMQYGGGRKRLSQEEIIERRNKGLCFGCNEPYTREHRCSRRQLYSMIVESVEEEEDEGDEVNHYVEDGDSAPRVTLHAINGEAGANAVQTMRLIGQFKKRMVHILVDSGSSHNFVDSKVAKGLGLALLTIEPIPIMVADGRRIQSTKAIKGFEWNMQGHSFMADFYIIPLKGCEVVLGVKWLAQLGDVTWNFQTLSMKFEWLGSVIALQGVDDREKEGLLKVEDSRELPAGSLSQLMTLCRVHPKGQEQTYLVRLTNEGVGENSDITNILMEFADVFQEPTGLPPERQHDHSITLKEGIQSVCVRPYRHSATQKDVVEKMIREMCESGIIRKSRSSFASPVVLVKKKDNTWRMCIDYRQLNQHTLKEKFPIPIIEELLDELHGSTVFSKVDLRAGFHQIRMNPAGIHKTAFRTHDGHYEFLVLPFGLTNAPSTFQGLMNDIYRPFLRQFVLVFFDDILIYSKTVFEHQKHLRIALGVLRTHALYAKRSKCSFGCSRVEYLGHYVDRNGVSTDPRKIAAVVEWPVPKTIKQLRGFLRLSGYYRRFIRGYGTLSHPLTSLLKKGAFSWGKEEQETFELLKNLLTTAPTLALPNFEKESVVETDACDKGIGAVLMQDRHPLAFISKALAPKHYGLSVYEKELLSVVYAVGKWTHYLSGRHFVIRTDHKSLKFLLEQRLHNESQFRWITKLMGYDYEIQYRPGRENMAADALSRVQAPELFSISLMQYQPTLLDQIKQSWEVDKRLQPILQQARNGGLVDGPYVWHQGLLKKKGRLVVGEAPEVRQKVMEIFHSSSLGGHSGMLATAKRIGSLFHWKGLERDVRNFVRDCDTCQRYKYDNTAPGKLQPLPIPKEMWTEISMDFIEGLPKSLGKDVIMVVVDRLSKYSHFVGLSHPYTAAVVAQAFVDSVYKLHGLPNTIVSDRDSIFLSNFWQEFFRLQGVELHLSSAYHPQTDGQTEVVNRCVETYLRCVAGDCPTEWFRWLSLAEWWYNTSYHTTIRTTPFEALYGYPPPIHVPYITHDKVVASVDEHLSRREAMVQLLRFHIDRAQHRMKQLADLHRTDREFAIGDWVYVKLQPYRQISAGSQFNQKLAPVFYGPYKILDRIGAVAYKLELPEDSAIHPTFHVSKLRRGIKDGARTSVHLPSFGKRAERKPVAILERKMVKRGNRAATKVLTQWSDSNEEDATWEFLYDLLQKYPQSALVDKCALKEGDLMQGVTIIRNQAVEAESGGEDRGPSIEGA